MQRNYMPANTERGSKIGDPPTFSNRIEWANSLRGVAAVSVLISHYMGVFWFSQPAAAALVHRAPLPVDPANMPWFARLVHWMQIDFGGLGVALFFLLSGYVIAMSLEKYSRLGFLVGRSMRILPTYAVGFLVTCSAVWLISGRPPIYEVAAGLIPGLSMLFRFPTVSDGIVWTLIIELAFYSICLIWFRKLTRSWVAITATGIGCAAVQILLQTPYATLYIPLSMSGARTIALLSCPYLLIMLIGVTVSACSRGNISKWSLLLVPVLTAGFLWLSATSIYVTAIANRLTYLVSIAVFLVISKYGNRLKRTRITSFMADISYPLYVVHGVLGYAVLYALTERNAHASIAVPGVTFLAVFVAFLIHRLIEMPTHVIGQKLARRLASSGWQAIVERPAVQTSLNSPDV